MTRQPPKPRTRAQSKSYIPYPSLPWVEAAFFLLMILAVGGGGI